MHGGSSLIDSKPTTPLSESVYAIGLPSPLLVVFDKPTITGSESGMVLGITLTDALASSSKLKPCRGRGYHLVLESLLGVYDQNFSG